MKNRTDTIAMNLANFNSFIEKSNNTLLQEFKDRKSLRQFFGTNMCKKLDEIINKDLSTFCL